MNFPKATITGMNGKRFTECLHKQYQYSEIAQNLYKTGPVSIDFTAEPEFVRQLMEALKDD